MATLDELRLQEYELRQKVNRLRQQAYAVDPLDSAALLDELADAEQELRQAEMKRAQAQEADEASGRLVKLEKREGSGGKKLGVETTGLDVQVYLRMAQVPSSIYHLFEVSKTPLVSGTLKFVGAKSQAGAAGEFRRLKVSSAIQGYSAEAVDTFELKKGAPPLEFSQLPTLFPDKIATLNEITRASLTIVIEDLDNHVVELHRTFPIWLLAKTTAPLAVRDPKTGQWSDLTPYLGAFVTPNAPAVMEFLRQAASKHPDGQLAGYQGNPTLVEPQIKAIYEALQAGSITYINSVIDFSPEDGSANQRVRLPAESLKNQGGNCIDGTVLFASLLEAISMNPAIVIVPGHAFLAYEDWSVQPDRQPEWRYLETTMLAKQEFEIARTFADKNAKRYQDAEKKTPGVFRRHSLRELRSKSQIFPMA